MGGLQNQVVGRAPLVNLIGEPVVDDARVAKAEQALRRKFPQIPEAAQFATYRQSPTFMPLANGLERPIPETAVFLVRVPSPKHDHKGIILTERGGELMSVWRQRDQAYKHLVGQRDPLEIHFEQLVRALADKHRNLRTMIS